MTIRVLVADDQTLVRLGLRAIIDSEPGLEVVGEAADGVDAVAAVRSLRPDVVLMDIRMPRLDGVAATRALLGGAGPPVTRVLILTTFSLDEYVVQALRAGASGYLLKDAAAHQLIEAIRVIAAGEAILAPTVTRNLLERFGAGDAHSDGSALRALLSEREVEVLLLMTAGQSNAEIAGTLSLAETTVKTHVRNILGKLGVRDRLQAVIAAYDAGLAHPRRSPS